MILKIVEGLLQTILQWKIFHIHPIILFPLYPYWGCGGLENIPAIIGWEAGYTMDRSSVCRRANAERQTTTTHINTYGQFRLTS